MPMLDFFAVFFGDLVQMAVTTLLPLVLGAGVGRGSTNPPRVILLAAFIMMVGGVIIYRGFVDHWRPADVAAAIALRDQFFTGWFFVVLPLAMTFGAITRPPGPPPA